MNYSNQFNLPRPIVDAIVNDPYDKGDADISITSLNDTPRKRILLREFSDLITVDVSQSLRSLRGQLVHAILEKKSKEYSNLAEKRFYIERDGIKIGGKPDYPLLEEGGILVDWKVVSIYTYLRNRDSIAKGKRDEWEKQLNLYRLLLHENGHKISRLRVWAWTDIRPGEMKKNEGWPQCEVVPLDLPLWTLTETEAYLQARLEVHKKADEAFKQMGIEAFSQDILCSEEDRWYSGTNYAVMQKGRKAALPGGLMREEDYQNPQEAAERYIQKANKPDLFIEKRPGTYRRCDWREARQYCAAYSICEQANPQAGSLSDLVLAKEEK